jgi:hypothetical protein
MVFLLPLKNETVSNVSHPRDDSASGGRLSGQKCGDEAWVAVEGDRLIAADVDPLNVFSAAKAAGIKTPFVVHVLPEDSLPFIPGW